jgi:hypothetical protein
MHFVRTTCRSSFAGLGSDVEPFLLHLYAALAEKSAP